MQSRNDSPFKNITKEQFSLIQTLHETVSAAKLAQQLSEMKPPLLCSTWALNRYIRRLKEEALLAEAEESADVMEKFAARGKDGNARDGTIEAARQRLFTNAVETNDLESLQQFFKMVNEEKRQDRLLALEERKVKVAEENAKVGHRKLELQAAQSALKLLPAIRDALMDATVSAEERVKRALECLMKQGGQMLLESGAKG